MSSSAYLQWSQAPTEAALAPNASLHYITTTTTINEPAAILKHLTAQSKQIEKKEEKPLHTVNGDRALAIETVTTLRFRSGGGAYLPNIDGNLLDERIVVFPVTHIVTFDADNKIQQIRLHWDQGTLLKQVEAIGKSGRNWPIREGKAQADAIASSVKAAGGASATSTAPAPKPTSSSGPSQAPTEVPIRGHSNRDSVSVTRDPHASLALFSERDPNEDDRSYAGPRHATRASARPPAREYGELFASEPGAAGTQPKPAAKAGSGKNFSDIRLFDENEAPEEPGSPERKRTYSQKYEHFAFGDGEDAPQPSRGGPDLTTSAGRNKSKSAATFSFEDFATPEKPAPKPARPNDERHWGSGIDEVSRKPLSTPTPHLRPFTSHLGQDDPTGSPPKRPIVHAARPDAQTHFELSDVSPLPSHADQAAKVKSLQRQKGMGLYHDPVMSDDRVSTTASRSQPTTTTNVDASRRGKDFSAQYSMADESPSTTTTTKPSSKQQFSAPNAPIARSAARSDMESHWSFGGSPEPAAAQRKIYKTAGDGMGSRSGGRAWGIGDESDPEIETESKKQEPRRSARGAAGRRREAEASEELDF